MAKVLIIHGISNQYGGEAELLEAWYPALCDGLNRAKHATPPKKEDCYCPFYGDLFRFVGAMGEGAVADPELTSANEMALLEAVWIAAAAVDPEVPSPADFKDTLIYAPRIVERALTALSKSKFLADMVPLRFLADLSQVALYLDDKYIRQRIVDRVLPQIADDTRIVIGHSLGSVIAYEAVAAKPTSVTDLITLGSPLGLRNVVFDKLTPGPVSGKGRWPGKVVRWTNISARGDIVAAEKTLAPMFGPGRVADWLIDSGWDAHSSTRYLNTAEAGAAVARGLQ